MIKDAKIRGRALRKLKTFLATNKEFAGHSSRNIDGIIRDEAIISPWRKFIASKPLTKMEGAGTFDTNVLKNPIAKFMLLPIQTSAMKNKILAKSIGYGSGGVLFKRPSKYSSNPLAKALGSTEEIIMKGKVKIPIESSIFLASSKAVKALNKKYPSVTIVSRKNFEKQFKHVITKDIW